MKKLFVSVATACLTLASTALIDARAQTVEIEYWQYFFKERVQAIDALIKTFEAANPGIKVKHTHFPYAQYQTKVAASVPAGEGPDVVQLYYGWLEEYRKAKLIEPLPKDQFDPAQIERDFFPIVKAMKADGAYWGLPTAVRSLALFYNRKLMAEAGLDPKKPPATLDELIAQSTKIVKRDGGGNLLTAGLTIGPVSQDHHWWREVLVRQFGGQAFSDDNKQVAYDKKGGVEALQFYADIAGKHRLSTFGFMDETQAAFRAGRAGFHIDGSFRIGTFQVVRNLDWGVAELPAHNGIRGNFASYWVNGVSSRAQGPRREAAMKFMKHLVSDEAMQLWLKTVGELPAKPGVAMTDANKNDPVYGPFILGLAYSHTTDFVNEPKQRQ
ncbi:MAG: extracellular solute-binding protein, partial [Alphaproteobacteria bacterium]|nr:extracellular solute-binding protein [Alphaproteobacteria bacterium]